MLLANDVEPRINTLQPLAKEKDVASSSNVDYSPPRRAWQVHLSLLCQLGGQ
jgi:hypothetical protein